MKLYIRWDPGSQNLDVLRQGLSRDWEILELAEGAPESELAGVLASADACISGDWPKTLPPAPNLKLLHTTGAGYDRLDFSALPAGCQVCNVFEHESAMAEYLVGAMLEWQIGMRRMDALVRKQIRSEGPHSHGRLQGKTVGFIGYGHIARETAARLAAFGVHVMARTRRPALVEELVHDIGGMDDLDSLLEKADFIVVCCPLNDATRGLIGEREFELMKPSAVLINVARAPIVDEDALYTACLKRRIGGAVIDVWYQYPKGKEPGFPSKRPLQDLENVWMTPHASADTEDLFRRRCQVIAENLNRLAKGEPLVNVVRVAV